MPHNCISSNSVFEVPTKIMVKTAADTWDETSFFENVETQFEQKAQDFSKILNIAVIGRVSSGKSSLINALLKRSRKKAFFRSWG